MEKLQQVLNDEESMAQIRELADMLTGGGDHPAPAAEKPSPAPAIGPAVQGPDIAKLMKLGQLVQSSAAGDKNIALLLALRPLLKPENQPKLDRAVKLLRLLDLWPVIKESGLVGGDLFGLL
ncbi:MAG: hypothetical protein IJ806_03885 [Ruminococcus sp.]|nr:hypothetical protein [Ruminococcus sp.]